MISRRCFIFGLATYPKTILVEDGDGSENRKKRLRTGFPVALWEERTPVAIRVEARDPNRPRVAIASQARQGVTPCQQLSHPA